MKYIITSLILLIPVILAGAEYSYTFSSDTAVSYIQLPHNNIFKNSIQFSSPNNGFDSANIKLIDYSEGIIVLANPYKFNSVIIQYEYLAYDLQNYFFKRKLDLQNSRIVQKVEPQKLLSNKPISSAHSNFKITGSKSFGISAGNSQDFDLNQTLKVQLRGEPVAGLTLIGSISDKAQPQVGGLSSSLEDIETVSLLAQGKNFSVTIGDINYKNNWGGMAEMSKRLKGIEANLEFDRLWGKAAISGVKGRFRSVEFLARDGLSGPYDLKSNNGSRISIVAGTERVYLDGRLLKAGASEDYIVDYGLGEITFSPKMLLSSNSRVLVDYEYLDQSYRRSLYSAEMGGWLSSQNWKVEFGYLDLSDSRSNPVDLTLSPQDITILESAGDNHREAVRSGIEFVGEGPGNYIPRVDTASNNYYEYVGDSLGQYNITFSRVDRNRGDYSYQGNGVYVYQGKNRGNYLPFEYLPLPAGNQAIYLNSTGKINQYAALDLKLSGSNYDQNSYSTLDDSNNQALWGNLNLNITPLINSDSTDFISGLSTRANILSRERNFVLPGRSETLELGRQWALCSNDIYKRSDRLEFFQQLNFHKYIKTASELGFYRDAGLISADRNKFSVSVFPGAGIRFNLGRQDRISFSYLENDSSTARLYQNQASAHLDYKKSTLTLGWRDEKDTRTVTPDSLNAFEYDKYYSELTIKNLRAGFSHTRQNSLLAISRDDFQDYLFSLGHSGLFWNRQISSQLDLVRRQVEYDSGLLPDLSETKLLSQTGFKFLSGAISGNLTYRLNRQRISRLARNFIKVEQGQGNYRLEDSVYVRDRYGDYILIDELIDEGAAGLLSEKSLQLKIDLLKLIPIASGLSAMNSETILKLEERGGNAYRLNGFYLLPFWRSYPDSELFSEFEIRQIFSLGISGGHHISLGFEEKATVDKIRDIAGDRYRRLIYEKIYLIVSPAVKFHGEHRFKRERERSGYFGSADFGEQDVLLEVQIYPGENLELSITPRYLHDYSKSDNLTVDLLGIKLSPTLLFSDRGRLEFNFSYYNVSAGDNQFIPYQYAAGNRPGDNYDWSAGINYKYSADKNPDLKTRHRVSLNVRASF